MNKDILFANGCSFTYGGGLEPWFMEYNNQCFGELFGVYDAQSGDFLKKQMEFEIKYNPDIDSLRNDDKRLRMLWPYKLMNMMGMSEHINLSQGCGSNQRMIRTTLEWIMEQDRSTLDRTIAIIQLTEPSRYEYYQEDTDHWTLNKVDHVLLKGTDAEMDLARRINDLRLSTFTPVEGIFNVVNTCLTLDNIFKTFCIDYYLVTNANYMCSMMELIQTHQPEMFKLDSHRYSESSLENYISLINKSGNWINETYEKSVLSEWNCETLSENDAHYSQLGHTQLASYIHRILDK